MRFRGDERSQSVQVGAVILFGFLIVGLSVYQVSVVPQQNSAVEFDQSQAIREDMAELRNQLQTTGVTGESRPVEMQLGARFPPRTLFVNPPPTSGTLDTENRTAANVTLVDGTVVGPATDDAERYWKAGRNFTAKLLVYEANYRAYDGAPANVTVQLGHTVASYPGGRTVNVTDRPGLLSNDRVTLVLVQGNLSKNGVDAVTVDPQSVSQITRRETINGTLNVTVPTTLPPSKIRGLVNGSDSSISVENVTSVAGGEAVRLELRGTIQLGIAAVGVGSGTAQQSPAYIDVESRENVTATQTGQAVIEVRDRFGNPVGGAEVNISITNNTGGSNGAATLVTDEPVTTDPDGTVTVSYTGTNNGTVALNASFTVDPETQPDDPAASGNTSVTIGVNSVASLAPGNITNGTGAGIANPTNGVQLVGSFTDGSNEAVFVLKNTGNTTKNLSRARIAFYFNRQGANDPTDATFVSSDNQPVMTVGGSYESVSGVSFQPVPPGSKVEICFRFSGGGGSGVDDDFFVTNFEFDDGTIRQYFVTPEGTRSCDPGGNGGGGGGGGAGASSADNATVTMSQATDIDTPTDVNATLEIQLNNTGSTPLNVQNVTVVSTTNGDVNKIDNGNSDEVSVFADTNGGGGMNGKFNIGDTISLTTAATVNGGNSATIEIKKFKKGNNQQDISGDSVTIRIGFQDGSVLEVTVTATG